MRPSIASIAICATVCPGAAGAQRAGQLIAAEPVRTAPAGMQAWTIVYWTTDGRGRPARVTGMVVAPQGATPRVPRDVLAWTHGTSGVATQCAPSLAPGFWTHSPGLDGVREGYVVVAPDYPGLGSAGVHPYLVGQDTGRSVLDAVRAARSIPAAAAGRRFAVWGESQGGHAALWTGQIARAYAPELQLVGVAAAAPTTDLVANVRQVPDRTVGALMTAFIGYSWAAHYGAPLATLGGPQTRAIMTRLAKNNCIKLDARPKLMTMLGVATVQARLKDRDLGTIQPWARLARLNSPTTTPFGVPMLIAQNPKDDLVAPAVTRAYAQALCRGGARLRYLTIGGSGHATSARDSAAATLRWIGDRFAGRPAPSDCGRI
ncbi:lipase family protein [Sphingomonas sp. A2-49]|uniref:lipase family protein n=1 Tax=Sphingomonas sp. A2-49 TaxID=1391375 RepID=UPI0021D24E7E|nr:lipase family protein [Sphingomonas sp. A2-49]MCU6454959.1 lipase family protein [Sphingomonas sp. A2-49]